MKRVILITMILLDLGVLWMPQALQAQGFFGDYCYGGSFVDTLDIVELSGTAIVQQSDEVMSYYLDTNGDDEGDYLLSFGPFWYEPDNGNQRPENGEQITVKGFLMSGLFNGMIMVYELNGTEWRNFDEDMMGAWHGFDHWVNDLESVTVSGTALVDHSFYYPQYFLDEDGDKNPDFYLHFGPYWFEPESGASRPEDGQSLSITGGLTADFMGYSSIMVYEINGLEWRDSFGPHPWSGRWVHRDFNDSTRVYCLSDSLSWVGFPAGCFGQGGGMMSFPDSLFCEFEEIHPDFAPGDHDSTLIACFYFDLMDQEGMGMMSGRGYGHGNRRLQGNPLIRLHYPEVRLQQYSLSDHTVILKGYDTETESWVEISDFTTDRNQNLVTLNRNKVYQYYAVFTPESASLGISEPVLSNMTLQVYPNPVSDQLTLRINLSESAPVTVRLLTVTGRQVARKTVHELNPGNHDLYLDMTNYQEMKPGIYFVEVLTPNGRDLKEFLLTK